MFKRINTKTKKILFITLFSLLVLLFLSLLLLIRDSGKIKEIKEFVKTDIKVVYVSNDKSNSKYPKEILNKYGVNYLEVDSSKFNVFERKKLENIVNSKYLNNILVIFESGKIKDALIEYKSKESVNEFLQKNDIIPKQLSDNVDKIFKEITNITDNDYSIVYLPYKNMDIIDEQNNTFEYISKKYSINYKKIDAYLLSKSQHQKINELLQLSTVEDQILILIKENQIIGNIRGVHSKNTYIENLYELNFISELEDKINEIDYNEFKKKLNSQEKSIILIGMDNSKDCEDVYNLLNGMIYNYEINVNYINVGSIDSEVYKKVQEKLNNIENYDNFSLPLVVVVESNNILDYVVGNTKEEYFLDTFIENGVIKGVVIDE